MVFLCFSRVFIQIHFFSGGLGCKLPRSSRRWYPGDKFAMASDPAGNVWNIILPAPQKINCISKQREGIHWLGPVTKCENQLSYTHCTGPLVIVHGNVHDESWNRVILPAYSELPTSHVATASIPSCTAILGTGCFNLRWCRWCSDHVWHQAQGFRAKFDCSEFLHSDFAHRSDWDLLLPLRSSSASVDGSIESCISSTKWSRKDFDTLRKMLEQFYGIHRWCFLSAPSAAVSNFSPLVSFKKPFLMIKSNPSSLQRVFYYICQ